MNKRQYSRLSFVTKQFSDALLTESLTKRAENDPHLESIHEYFDCSRNNASKSAHPGSQPFQRPISKPFVLKTLQSRRSLQHQGMSEICKSDDDFNDVEADSKFLLKNLFKSCEPLGLAACKHSEGRQVQQLYQSSEETLLMTVPSCNMLFNDGHASKTCFSFAMNASNECKRGIDMKQKEELTNELIKTKFEDGFIDTHCHIDFLFRRIKFNKSFKMYMKMCEKMDPFPESFEGCITVFCEPSTFYKINWWEGILENEYIWGAFGCHPHYADQFGHDEELLLRYTLKNNKVKALGEIGLDFSKNNNQNRQLQEEVYRRQLHIAVELKMPLVIHSRDSSNRCLSILKEIVPKDHIIHRHCFTGDWEEAYEWLSYFPNLYIGVTCLITQNSSLAIRVKKALLQIPLERLLLETDAPYFRPDYLPGTYSHPGMAIHVAAAVAALKNINIRQVLSHTRINTRAVYSV